MRVWQLYSARYKIDYGTKSSTSICISFGNFSKHCRSVPSSSLTNFRDSPNAPYYSSSYKLNNSVTNQSTLPPPTGVAKQVNDPSVVKALEGVTPHTHPALHSSMVLNAEKHNFVVIEYKSEGLKQAWLLLKSFRQCKQKDGADKISKLQWRGISKTAKYHN